jgi:N-acetylneuraminic acid mutarotase
LERQQPLEEVWRIGRAIRSQTIGKLKTETALAASGIIEDHLYVFGGCSDPAEITGIRAGGLRLDLIRGKISPVNTPGDAAFCLTAHAVVRRGLFIFGGARPDPKTVYASLDTAWAFETDKNVWRKLQNYPMSVRGAVAVNLDDRRILIGAGYGGQPEDFLKTAFIYDTKANSYAATLDFPVAAIVGALLRHNGVVYCLGGEDSAHRTAACFSIKVSELIKAAKPAR